jgi:hypothetical protein
MFPTYLYSNATLYVLVKLLVLFAAVMLWMFVMSAPVV